VNAGEQGLKLAIQKIIKRLACRTHARGVSQPSRVHDALPRLYKMAHHPIATLDGSVVRL